ncbi:MAG: hypothetical protein OXG04_29465 [Acidobacteria bacterium]|nr:hypothetical protein [Acidobacteriota bacterium]
MAIGRFSFGVAALAAAFWIGWGPAPAAGAGPNEAGFAELTEGVLVPAGTGAAAEPAAGSEGGTPEGAAEEQDTEEQEVDVEELERRIELLAEELERLRSGEPENEVTIDQARALGLAPSAAATYAIDSGVSIAGYGEALYENYASDKTTQFDYLRAILYAGYRFNDKFLFNSEIEVEHAKEIFVEFAYVDYLATPNFGLRAGMLLIPMGLVNEFHEPTVFIGAERPVTENKIIPTTWRENGGGVYGAFDNVAFRAYVVNGFNGSAFSSGGLRGGRQKGGKAKANDMAFTGRLDITPTPGVFFGGSFYTGGSGQGDIVDDNGRNYGVRTSIFDVHAQAQARGFDFRALFAQAGLDDTSMLNQVLGLEGSKGVAEKMQGGYVQLGYDLLSQAPAAGGVGLTPYLRLEKVDTHTALAAGFTRDPGRNNRYTTFGIELKPIPNIVLKVDHMWVGNAVDSGVNQFNVNVGYAF